MKTKPVFVLVLDLITLLPIMVPCWLVGYVVGSIVRPFIAGFKA